MTDAASAAPAFGLEAFVSTEFSKCPQPYYERMRETAPVIRAGDDSMPLVFVAGNENVDRVLHTPQTYSAGWHRNGPRPDEPLIPINLDPPEQRRYRRLLDPFFNPREMAKLESKIVAQVNSLIDGFVERGECDYAAEYAVPLPCTVFLQLMGLPLDELPRYLELKEQVLRGSTGNPFGEDEARTRAHDELEVRFESLIEERRADPRDDVLSKLLAAEIDGDRLSQQELLGICHLLFIAGLDTVTDSLTCFYAFLANSPAHRDSLVSDPETIPAAIEEMLRYESPVPFVPRIATTDTELAGCPIHAGDQVIVLLGSANTDEAAIERADVVDFARGPVPHVAFGGGVHRCLGSHLARIELRVSLREWHRRIPEYHIKDDIDLEFAAILRQVEHLPLVFDRVIS